LRLCPKEMGGGVRIIAVRKYSRYWSRRIGIKWRETTKGTDLGERKRMHMTNIRVNETKWHQLHNTFKQFLVTLERLRSSQSRNLLNSATNLRR
jgi:hypothetical protein